MAQLANEKKRLSEKEDKREKYVITLANIYQSMLSKIVLLLNEGFPITMQHKVCGRGPQIQSPQIVSTYHDLSILFDNQTIRSSTVVEESL